MNALNVDLKKTVNLPKTEFPMKANLPTAEPKMLAKWEEDKLYHAIRKVRAGRQQYVLHDGPPYANGPIHLGHALNKGLKDFVVKSKTMAGFDSPYVPGFDCHGLPIEIKIDEKLGRKKLEMPVPAVLVAEVGDLQFGVARPVEGGEDDVAVGVVPPVEVEVERPAEDVVAMGVGRRLDARLFDQLPQVLAAAQEHAVIDQHLHPVLGATTLMKPVWLPMMLALLFALNGNFPTFTAKPCARA